MKDVFCYFLFFFSLFFFSYSLPVPHNKKNSLVDVSSIEQKVTEEKGIIVHINNDFTYTGTGSTVHNAMQTFPPQGESKNKQEEECFSKGTSFLQQLLDFALMHKTVTIPILLFSLFSLASKEKTIGFIYSCVKKSLFFLYKKCTKT